MPLKTQALPASLTSLWEAVRELRRDVQQIRAARGVLADWAALPYGSGWSDYGTPYLGGRYHKLSGGTVELEGLATAVPAPTAGAVITTLPTGFRPAADVLVGRIACGTAATLDLYIRSATGALEVQNISGTFQWLPLTGLRFSTT